MSRNPSLSSALIQQTTKKDKTILDVCDAQLERLKELMISGDIGEDAYHDGCKMVIDLITKTFVIPDDETQEGSS